MRAAHSVMPGMIRMVGRVVHVRSLARRGRSSAMIVRDGIVHVLRG